MAALAVGKFTTAGEVTVIEVPAIVAHRVHTMWAIQAQRHGQIAICIPLVANVAFLNFAIVPLQLDSRQVVICNERTFTWSHWPDGMSATMTVLTFDATVSLAQPVETLIFSKT